MGAQDAPKERGFQVLGVDHVTITAPEELEIDVIKWYLDCLGLEQIDKPGGTRPRGAWFQAGGQEIHLQIDEHNPPKAPHVGLVVDDYAAVVARLREAKCHIEQAGVIPGRHRFFTRDPAGNQLEILAYEEEDTVVEYVEEADHPDA